MSRTAGRGWPGWRATLTPGGFTLRHPGQRDVTKLEDDIDARFTKLDNEIDARFATVDARFTKLEENQHDIALTLARLVALFEAHDEAEATPSG